MDRRDFIKNLGFGAVLLAGAGERSFAGKKSVSKGNNEFQASPGRQPNVVLIITDDQGYGDLACLGNPIIKTPAIDKLHSQSTRLTNFHVGPTCAPTRAGLMTGRYCNRTGVWHTIMGRSILRKDEVTMADVFKGAGYKTAIFGKWHLGDNYPYRPQDRGFDEVLIHGGGGVSQAPDYWDNDYFDDTYFHNGKPEKFQGYCTDIWFANAMKFIENNKDRPFFIYFPTNAAHSPYMVEEKYSSPYKDNPQVPDANFYGMIANIDENVGKLNDHLKKLGLEENTILIFMGDNGTASGFGKGKGFNAGMKGIKGSPYEGGHRVHFFIRWPNGKIQAGRDIDRLTAHIDVLPTLIDICQISNAPKIEFDGKSLKPLLSGQVKDWPDRVIVTDSQRVENPVKWRQSATMTEQWRLVNGKELYDIKQDPGQENDISKSHPEVVKNLRDEYEKWWKSVSKRFDEYSRIVIGSEMANPVRLTGHDGHGDPAWSQKLIRAGAKTVYFWAVEIEQDGEYEFELRRWPAEINKPIRSGLPKKGQFGKGVALDIVSGGLEIGDIKETKSVEAEDAGLKFKVKLTAGPKELNAWFIDSKNAKRSAYYVYAKKI